LISIFIPARSLRWHSTVLFWAFIHSLFVSPVLYRFHCLVRFTVVLLPFRLPCGVLPAFTFDFHSSSYYTTRLLRCSRFVSFIRLSILPFIHCSVQPLSTVVSRFVLPTSGRPVLFRSRCSRFLSGCSVRPFDVLYFCLPRFLPAVISPLFVTFGLSVLVSFVLLRSAISFYSLTFLSFGLFTISAWVFLRSWVDFCDHVVPRCSFTFLHVRRSSFVYF